MKCDHCNERQARYTVGKTQRTKSNPPKPCEPRVHLCTQCSVGQDPKHEYATTERVAWGTTTTPSNVTLHLYRLERRSLKGSDNV